VTLYSKIVVALKETIPLMQEIHELIPSPLIKQESDRAEQVPRNPMEPKRRSPKNALPFVDKCGRVLLRKSLFVPESIT
jgi:hypothetical protein